MLEKRDHRSGRTHTRAAFAAATLLLLAGCGEDSVEQAIRDATVTLNTISAAGGMSIAADPTAEGQTPEEKRFAEVLQGLESVKSDNAGESAAVSLLKARATGGIAQIKAAQARFRERRALDQVGAIRAIYDQWLGQRATASALEQYDVRQPIAQIDAEIAGIQAELAEQQTALGEIERALADLEAQAAAARSKVSAQRAQDSALRQQMTGASETQRAGLLEQASVFRRAADQFEKEAGFLEADAAAQRPRVAQARTMIERFATQTRLLEAEKNALAGKAAASQTSARQIRTELATTGSELAAALAELETLRERTSAPMREAESLFGKAAAEAQNASKGGRGQGPNSGAVVAASYFQQIGDTLFDRVRGIHAYGELMRTLGEVGAEIPGDFAAKASAADTALAEARTAAGEAYASAIDRLENAGGGDDIRQRIDALKQQLTDLKSYALDEKDAPAPKTATVDAGGADAAPAGETGDVAADVKASFKRMMDAMQAGDLGVLKNSITVESDEHRPALEALTGVLDKAMAFSEGFKSKFGVSFAEKAQAAMAGMGGMDQLSSMAPGLGDVSMDDVEVEVVSETEVLLKVPDQPEAIKAVKQDGAWVMVLPAEQAAQLQGMEPVMQAIGQALDDTAAEIAADRYPNVDLVMPVLMQRIFGAMQNMPGGAGGDDGDGGGN